MAFAAANVANAVAGFRTRFDSKNYGSTLGFQSNGRSNAIRSERSIDVLGADIPDGMIPVDA
jgi:hypothetical protein